MAHRVCTMSVFGADFDLQVTRVHLYFFQPVLVTLTYQYVLACMTLT